MTYLIDFDGLQADLFVLQHAAYGSKMFCEKFDLHTDCVGEYEWWEYKGLLKSFVSNKTIEAAIKIRMTQDFAKYNDDEIDLNQIDADARNGLLIGSFNAISKPLTLRESCNKIVHATEVRMNWVNSSAKPEVEYWNGVCELLGEYKNVKWRLALNIPEWCSCMIRFNKYMQDNIDWYRVYKNDA